MITRVQYNIYGVCTNVHTGMHKTNAPQYGMICIGANTIPQPTSTDTYSLVTAFILLPTLSACYYKIAYHMRSSHR